MLVAPHDVAEAPDIGFDAPSTHRLDIDLGPLRRRAAGLTTLGQHAAAIPLWAEIVQRCPAELAATLSLGAALLESDQPQAALHVLAQASTQNGDTARLARLTGLALLKLGATGPAAGAFYHALALEPQDAETHGLLATALLAANELDAAATHGREAFRLAPTAAHATTLSCILLEQGETAAALAVSEQGLIDGRPLAELMVNRSIALECMGDGPAAVDAAQRALLVSRTATVEHHMAALLLSQGQLTAQAWTLFEARLALRHARRNWPAANLRWHGQDAAARTILLHAEQGLGDTLQFVRYVPRVVASGARVVLVVQPALKRLLSDNTGAEQVLAVGDPLPPFDLFAPLMSLPGVFGTTLADIPPAIPYRPAAATGRRGRLRVGLVWSGSEAFVEDRKRSIPPALMWQLGAVPNVEAFSLQHGATALPDEITDLVAGVIDMADTAARLATLDLVISVDTAVAHLAATMGKPVWLLSRFRGCWRWLEHRQDSPWYPTLTLYRQDRPGDWDTVVARVGQDLADLASR